MIYIFSGEPSAKKNQAISDLKEKLIPSPDGRQFDYQSLNADKLRSADLKEALIALPALSKRRCVVITAASKLAKNNQELLLSLIEEGLDHVDVLFDFETLDRRSSLGKKLEKIGRLKSFDAQERINIFSVTNCIPRDPGRAIRELHKLFDQGEHPLRMMPGMVWFWGNKMRSRVTPDNFQKGLGEFRAADLNIKRSRLKPDVAMELLIVKLCGLA